MSEYKKIKVNIIDLGFNNTFSIFQAFKSLGCKVKLIDKIDNNKIDLLVLPGVGSYAKGMKSLKEKNFDIYWFKSILEKKDLLLISCTKLSEDNSFLSSILLIILFVILFLK